MFGDRGWLDDPASYIGEPPRLVETERCRTVEWPMRLQGLTFPSEWEPHHGEPGRDRWLSYEANRTARAYVLRHGDDRPRPWLVCLHGTAMGRPEVDPWVLKVKHLYDDLGLNVVLPILPLHGARGGPRSWDVQFPTVDVLDNVHGLAQAAWDVRRVLSWVRAQEPIAIALTGLSLGGYVAALVAGLDAPLDCVIAGMPAVDFPRVLRRHTPREIRELDDFRLLGEKADLLHRAVSPLLPEPASSTRGRPTVSSIRSSRSSRCGSTGAGRRSSGSTPATSAISSPVRAPVRSSTTRSGVACRSSGEQPHSPSIR
jgi:acetyl esterase/lipase